MVSRFQSVFSIAFAVTGLAATALPVRGGSVQVVTPAQPGRREQGDPDQPIVIASFRSNAYDLAVYEKEQDADAVASTSKGSYRIVQRGSMATWACANVTRFEDQG
jgi:hypothetical protein